MTETEVVGITADVNRVTGVNIVVNGRRQHISAANVALAAGAIETPLLSPEIPFGPVASGLANKSGLVGRNLMRHFIDLVGIFSWSRQTREDQKEIGLNDFYCPNGKKYGTLADFGRMPPVTVILEDLDNDLSSAGPIKQRVWRENWSARWLDGFCSAF